MKSCLTRWTGSWSAAGSDRGGASWDRLREAAKLALRWKLVAGIDEAVPRLATRAPCWAGRFAALRRGDAGGSAEDTGLRQFTYRVRGECAVFSRKIAAASPALHHVNTLNMLGVAFIGVPPDSSWVDEEIISSPMTACICNGVLTRRRGREEQLHEIQLEHSLLSVRSGHGRGECAAVGCPAGQYPQAEVEPILWTHRSAVITSAEAGDGREGGRAHRIVSGIPA